MDIAGHNIRRIRREKGLSRDALAARVNISAVALGRYERGERIPPAVVIRRLIDWSGGALSLDDFVPREGQSTNHLGNEREAFPSPEH